MTRRNALWRKPLLTLCALIGLSGCGGVEVTQYAQEQPTLDLKRYFNGTIDAYGMFQKRSGEVVQRFPVVIDARWQGDVGTLDERFTYSDGTTQQRVWTITKTGTQTYRGTAADVIGEAVALVMHCAGSTYWHSRLMTRSTMSISTTGCS